MSQDLLAPPKLTLKVYTRLIAGIAALVLVAGTAMGVVALLTLGEIAGRATIVAVVGVLAVWVYARLLRLAAKARPERMPYVHAAISFMGLAAFYAMTGVMLQGTGLGGGFVWMLPAAVGMTLAVGGWGRRVGESLHCPQCEYEFAFREEEAPIKCPECATPWLGRLRKGRRIRSFRMMAAGIALAVTGMIVLQPIFYVGPLAKHMPTPILFASLYGEPKSIYTAWEELAKRPLGHQWINMMAERVLAHRNRQQWDLSGSIWFEAMMKAGKLSPDLTERFYSEGFRARLIVPTSASAGKPFSAKLRVTRAADGWGAKVGVMFAGFAIDDGTPIGGATEAAWGYQLRPRVFSSHRDMFEQTLTLNKPGPARIRAVYWIIYQPSFWKIDWADDGTPVRPAAAAWFERVVVDETVIVK